MYLSSIKKATYTLSFIVLYSTTNQSLAADNSPAQLVVKGDTLVQEMNEAQNQGPCISLIYETDLLNRVNSWSAAAQKLPQQDQLKITSSVDSINKTKNNLKNMPVCGALPQKNTSILEKKPDTSPSQSITKTKDSTYLGFLAAKEAKSSEFSTTIGHLAGYNLEFSPYTVTLGASSGEQISDAPFSVTLGGSAGRFAKTADHTLFLGSSSGYFAKNVNFSMFSGYAAGRYIKNSEYSFISGYAAGEYADNTNFSIFLGRFSGYHANKSPSSIFIGRQSGMYARSTPSAVVIGNKSGRSAFQTTRPIFIGKTAGESAANTKDVILIGTSADAEPGIENAVGIGKNANPTQSNTWHIPDPLQIGIGTSAPTAQLHTTKQVRFEALANGVLVTDEQGNVAASTLLHDALLEIAALKKRIKALEEQKKS